MLENIWCHIMITAYIKIKLILNMAKLDQYEGTTLLTGDRDQNIRDFIASQNQNNAIVISDNSDTPILYMSDFSVIPDHQGDLIIDLKKMSSYEDGRIIAQKANKFLSSIQVGGKAIIIENTANFAMSAVTEILEARLGSSVTVSKVTNAAECINALDQEEL